MLPETGQSFPPCPAPFNMAAYVLATGADDAVALDVVGPAPEHWTYGALRAAVAGVARGLIETGLRPGDRVLMRQGNTVDFPITYLACLWADLIPVPTSAALTAPEVAGLIAAVTPRALTASPGVALPQTSVPVIALDTLRGWHGAPALPPALGDPERPGYIIFTSGSSGRPKAVCHAHRAIWARRMMWEGWYGLRADDRVLHAGAFNWTYTLGTGLMDPWAIGATALIPAPNTLPTDLPALLARARATIFAAAPGVYRQMLRGRLPPLPHLRHGLSAGEALPDTLRQAWQAATGCAVHEALGMSECSTFISGSPARPAPAGTHGFAQPGRRIAIRAEATAPGPLCIHRSDPGLMLGYWDGGVQPVPEWFETGDLVARTAQGAIRYHGRSDDMMNAGGFRVSPLEVEAALRQTPGLQEIAVCEVAVSQTASVIAAFHVGADAATLEAEAHRRLARYKQPRLWVPLDALPRSANGKLDRRALAQRAVAHQALAKPRAKPEEDL